jgi:hypothetical protein
MDEVAKHRLKGIFLFSILGVLSFGIFYVAYHGPWDPRLRNYIKQGPAATKKPPPPSLPLQDGKFTLLRGRRITIGNRALIYYGVNQECLHLAVYVLDLDAQTAYHHQIPIHEARRGFRIAGHEYILVSAHRSSIQLAEKPSAPKNKE